MAVDARWLTRAGKSLKRCYFPKADPMNYARSRGSGFAQVQPLLPCGPTAFIRLRLSSYPPANAARFSVQPARYLVDRLSLRKQLSRLFHPLLVEAHAAGVGASEPTCPAALVAGGQQHPRTAHFAAPESLTGGDRLRQLKPHVAEQAPRHEVQTEGSRSRESSRAAPLGQAPQQLRRDRRLQRMIDELLKVVLSRSYHAAR